MTHDAKTRIYTVAVHFRSLRNGQLLKSNLWEEVIFVIVAESKHRARDKAIALARERNCEYTTSAGERLKWEFFQVAGVHEVEEQRLRDGSELFSRYLKSSEAQSLVTPFGY